MSQKFHVTASGDVRKCNATKRPCRYGNNDHFTDIKEARQEVENRLSKETTNSPFAKTTQKENITKKLVDRVLQYDKFIPTDDLLSIGKEIDNEVMTRLGFDPFSRELTKEDLRKITTINREILAELTEVGADFSGRIVGSRAKDFSDAIKLLPNAMKERLKHVPFEAKATVKNRKGVVANFRVGDLRIKDNSKRLILERPVTWERMKNLDIEPGELYSPHIISNEGISENTAGTQAFMFSGTYGELHPYWIGKEPKQDRSFYKKLPRQKIMLNAEEIEADVYEAIENKKEFGYKFQIPKNISEEAQSSIVHEYLHAMQECGATNDRDINMFNDLAGDKTFSYDYNMVVYKGFPEEYMGNTNKLEFLSRSVEGVLFPHAADTDFLYKNSDKTSRESLNKIRYFAWGILTAMGHRR